MMLDDLACKLEIMAFVLRLKLLSLSDVQINSHQ
ncbi:hypothetical protein SLEP1_g9084 [Rubroshorea leprosula]|uniref:Uncharacterized protein n=1 Tax=Rubroshorea leprosula TaxID=152421 RepID=A0AAV5I3U8_9ROSI|nr:hypothetical protein SLEP1_g9084 [Rubroshorea leprosula]